MKPMILKKWRVVFIHRKDQAPGALRRFSLHIKTR
jgi:hypothetical protein